MCPRAGARTGNAAWRRESGGSGVCHQAGAGAGGASPSAARWGPPAPVLGIALRQQRGISRRVRDLGMEFFLASRGCGAQRMGSRGSDGGQAGPGHVCEGEPPAVNLGGVDQQNPGARVEEVLLDNGGRQTRRTRLAWREVFLQHDLRHAGGELERVWLVVDWPAGDPEPITILGPSHRPPTKARCLKLSRSVGTSNNTFSAPR